jgi:hypothetical protein
VRFHVLQVILRLISISAVLQSTVASRHYLFNRASGTACVVLGLCCHAGTLLGCGSIPKVRKPHTAIHSIVQLLGTTPWL